MNSRTMRSQSSALHDAARLAAPRCVVLVLLALPFAACNGSHHTTPPATVPAAPEILAVTVEGGTAEVVWTLVPDATSYNLYWARGQSLDLQAADRLRQHDRSSHRVTGLRSGDTYCFAVSANAGDAEGPLSTVHVRALAPGVVSAVSATPGDGQVTLGWPAVHGAATYALYRGTDAGVTKATGERLAPIVPPHVDTGLVNDRTYYYRISAIGDGGEGPACPVVMAVPRPVAANSPSALAFAAGIEISEKPAASTFPGQEASSIRVVQLNNTPGGVRDGRLVVTYTDAGFAGQVWDPHGGQHAPSDIFVRYSDDRGISWSPPVNVSRTAGLYSAASDWNGDGVEEIYWGDTGKPTIFASGQNLVIVWAGKYVPEATWTWGQVGQSAAQGRVGYLDSAASPHARVVPFAAQFCAISTNGGTTWQHGAGNPPLQLTYGRRDVADNCVVRGNGARWAIVWQEDPEGLQIGEAEGPGEGASGSMTTPGTDIWYTWTADLVGGATALRTNRLPLTNHSRYDRTGANGFPTVGEPGAAENHAASRPNLQVLNAGGVVTAVVAYEETKGLPTGYGKTVQLHIFPFDAPIHSGAATAVQGSAGTQLSDPAENSRRVRFLAQAPNGVDPAIAVFWRQGVGDHGAPADIVLRVATALDEAVVAAAPLRNLSSRTETGGTLFDPTGLNPNENANAHRGLLRGAMLVLGYCYCPDGPLAQTSALANYDFWIRRSLDGGASWLAPQNITRVANTWINVKEPRLVAPPNTAGSNQNGFVVAWGTETNVPAGAAASEPLDIFATRTLDQGATFEPITAIAATSAPESEAQLVVEPDGSRVYAVWNRASSIGESSFAIGGNPLRVATPSAPTAIGHAVEMTLHAPAHEGHPYVAAAALGITPGLMTPYGRIALNDDALLAASLGAQGPGVSGFVGLVPPNGLAPASLFVPADAGLIGMTFYVGFVTISPGGPWGLAAPGRVDIRSK